jgi:hypothetical protein
VYSSELLDIACKIQGFEFEYLSDSLKIKDYDNKEEIEKILLSLNKISNNNSFYNEILFSETNDKNGIQFYINCSDLFHWGCADCQYFSELDIPNLIQAYKDMLECEQPRYFTDLWCCRKREMRPQKPYYKFLCEQTIKLFNECGPERNV